MIDEDLSFYGLAERTGYSREAISRAVNHGQHPRVLRKVKEVLGVR